MRVGKYELGRTLGEGSFGKVKLARNLDSGLPFAVKIIDKHKIIRLNFSDQVLASKSKIYMVLEYVSGGELYDRIASKGRGVSEAEGRKMFHQLIDGVSYCHNHGVFHRDLKVPKDTGNSNNYCGCWDSSPGHHGHNVIFLPLNYSHFR